MPPIPEDLKVVVGFFIGLSVGSSIGVVAWLAASAWARESRRRAFVDGRNLERRAHGQKPLPIEQDEEIAMYGIGS